MTVSEVPFSGKADPSDRDRYRSLFPLFSPDSGIDPYSAEASLVSIVTCFVRMVMNQHTLHIHNSYRVI